METHTSISTSADPLTLLIFISVFVLAIWWPRKPSEIVKDSRVGRRRRFIAIYVDLFAVMAGIMPFVALPSLFLEYRAVGEWAWNFKRDYLRSTDWVILPMILLSFYFIYLYFKWHFNRGRQTIGQYLLGMQLIANGESPSVAKKYLTAWANAA